MRILYLSPSNLWPLTSGGRLRIYYLVRETTRYASVSFFGVHNPNEDNSASANHDHWLKLGLERFVLVDKARSYTTWKVVRGLVGHTPLSILNYYDPKVARELSRLLREQTFDLVQIEQVQMMGYLSTIRACPNPPLVVCDWHNIESELMDRYGRYTENWARKLYAGRTAHLLRGAERRLLAECDAHIVVSKRDEATLRALAPKAVVHTVENGVDVARYSGQERPASSATVKLAQETRTNIVFVGSMDYHANIDAASYFCAEIWPKVHALAPELRFMIVGSRPVAEVRDLARIPGVVVTGTVDDVAPYYRSALAAIVPLRIGGGTRLKILEAMAAGIPVVSTSIGAEGLTVNAGVNIALADTSEEMIRVLMELYESYETWQRLSDRGRELASALYDWSVVGSSLHRIHRVLLDQRNRG
jgi:glycosyltransferase involved in cell wall biosynthesis